MLRLAAGPGRRLALGAALAATRAAAVQVAAVAPPQKMQAPAASSRPCAAELTPAKAWLVHVGPAGIGPVALMGGESILAPGSLGNGALEEIQASSVLKKRRKAMNRHKRKKRRRKERMKNEKRKRHYIVKIV